MSELDRIPAAETARFVTDHLAGSGRILEVGAGRGEVALLLGRAGYEVLAIDASPDVVDAAIARGVTARVARWPDFDETGFSAVLFTRSLHHISPLNRAISRASAALVPGGRVLVEDFAFSQADEATIVWFHGVLRGLSASGSLADGTDEFAQRLLDASDPIATWRDEEGPHMHGVDSVRGAICDALELEHEEEAPYLYRYVHPLLTGDRAATTLEGVLRAEVAAGGAGTIELIGRRFVATRR